MKPYYNAWREAEIKRIGLRKQLKAEALADKIQSQPLVEIRNLETGKIETQQAGPAEIYKRNRQAESASRKSFSVPDWPWKKEEA